MLPEWTERAASLTDGIVARMERLVRRSSKSEGGSEIRGKLLGCEESRIPRSLSSGARSATRGLHAGYACWSVHVGRARLVFVDGSHAYDYAKKDSETAMRLVKAGGIVLWRDYGVWPGVTLALEELETTRRLGLVNIRGSSLVFWRAGEDADS